MFYELSQSEQDKVVQLCKARCPDDSTTDCCIWKGSVNGTPLRPVIILNSVKRKQFDVRRFYYQIEHPTQVLSVSKLRCTITMTCDNAACVNVSHMELSNNVGRWDSNEILKRLTAKSVEKPSPPDLIESCLEWCGHTRNGYGQISVVSKTYDTHVLALLLQMGITEAPQDDLGRALHARHKCQNKKCIRASHLEFGTPFENGQDRIRDGTNNSGESNANHKISEHVARQIKLSWTDIQTPGHKSIAERAKEFGVSTSTIFKIDKGLNWSHLSGPLQKDTENNKAIEARRRADIADKLRRRGLDKDEYLHLQALIAARSVITHDVSKDPEVTTPCLFWQGRKIQGYGTLKYKYVEFLAHVLVCEALLGKTPHGYVVAHKCGNKCCVAPEHLSIATRQENGQDAVRHGDLICKLSARDVHEIRASCDLADKIKIAAAAKKYNITKLYLKKIIKGKTWSWLKAPGMTVSRVD